MKPHSWKRYFKRILIKFINLKNLKAKKKKSEGNIFQFLKFPSLITSNKQLRNKPYNVNSMSLIKMTILNFSLTARLGHFPPTWLCISPLSSQQTSVLLCLPVLPCVSIAQRATLGRW